MGVLGDQGKKLVKRDESLSQGEVVAFFRMIIVQVDTDDAGGKATEVLGVIDVAQPVLGGSVTKIMPVAKGGGGQTVEDHFPKIIGGNFPRVLAAFQAEADTQGRGLFTDPEQNFLHPGPGFLKGFFMRPDGVELLLNKRAGTDLAGQSHVLERVNQPPGSGGADMKNDQARSKRGGTVQRFERVAFRQSPGGGAGVREFVGVGMGAEDFHGHGTKIVQDLDFWCPTRFVFGQNAGPKRVAGVVAEFDLGEAQSGGFLQEGRAVGASFGVPAGGEGQVNVGHVSRVSAKNGFLRERA